MVFKKMLKNLLSINLFIIVTFYSSLTLAKNHDFERWLNEFISMDDETLISIKKKESLLNHKNSIILKIVDDFQKY